MGKLSSLVFGLWLSATLLVATHAARTQQHRAANLIKTDSQHASITSDKDQITSLPGYTGNLKSKHYSGYIEVSKSKRLFYYFVLSENDPATDPVVLWLNGGPGCSSFDGFIYEMGPFKYQLVQDHANHSTVQLTDNPYAWNKVANMIYLDSPAGVGLSYSTDTADYFTGDGQTAADANVFLRGFFKHYPGFSSNAFYISGESYAGVYVPNLAKSVVEGNLAGQQPFVNLVGYLVGNGVTDEQVDGDATPPFAVGKSLISYQLYHKMQKTCRDSYWDISPGTKCEELYNQMLLELSDLNIYNVLGDCFHGLDPSEQDAHRQALLKAKQEHGAQWPLLGSPSRPGLTRNYAHLGLTPPCTDARHADKWLNEPAVRQAIHAAPAEEIGKWQLCSGKISYMREISTMIPIHKWLLEKGLRALIYSGDHDLAVPHTGSERWTAELGLEEVTGWAPWLVADNQVAGYAVEYEGGLSYATVKGAGHMVPQTNPRESLALFTRFIQGKPLHKNSR